MSSANNKFSDKKISIITVTYNAGRRLISTIESVLNQQYSNVEYIIIDGQSTDGTIDIIKRYQQDIAYWISEPDNGVYDAMNKGVKVATGDWIYFLGAGDLLLKILHKVVTQFNDKDTLYYGDVYKLDESAIYNGAFSAFKLAVKNICHQSVFYPSVVFKKYQYNLKYKMQADHDLNMRCFGDEQVKFKYIPYIIAVYEGDGFSALNNDTSFFCDKLQIVKENFSPMVYYYASARKKVRKLLNRDVLNK